MSVTTHIIIGTLPTYAELLKRSGDRSTPTILPPHPFATRIPFRTHPLNSKLSKKPRKLTFRDNIEISMDRVVADNYEAKATKGPDNDGGFDDASWYHLHNEKPGERVGLPAMVFLADLCRNTPGILPKADQPGPSWFPTMSFQVEFKMSLSSIPKDMIAPHTFGVWSTGRFIHLGRHEVHSEVWTAPTSLLINSDATGTAEVDPDWREKQLVIVRSSQMALTIPLEVNARKAKKQEQAAKL